MVLATGLASIHQGRAGGRATFHRPDMAGVEGRPGEVEHVGRPQLIEQQLVQPLPDSGLVPVPKPSPARHPRAEAQFLG